MFSDVPFSGNGFRSMTLPPNPSAVDRAARFLLFDHIGELAWRVENLALTIQAQGAGGDEAGVLHSMGRLYLTVQCLKDAEKQLKFEMMKEAAAARAEKKSLTSEGDGATKANGLGGESKATA